MWQARMDSTVDRLQRSSEDVAEGLLVRVTSETTWKKGPNLRFCGHLPSFTASLSSFRMPGYFRHITVSMPTEKIISNF